MKKLKFFTCAYIIEVLVIKIEKIDVVDVVIATDKGVPLVLRMYQPYKDCPALPGGHVDPKDYLNTSSAEDAYRKAATREAEEETHLKIEIIRKIKDYDNPSERQRRFGLTHRDPRGNYVSHAYLARAIGGELRADDDAKLVEFFKKIPENIAFDHDVILKDSGLFKDGVYVGLI